MDHTAEILAKVGEAMYGRAWQTPLANDLSVSDRTVRRWVAGDPIPDGIWPEIVAICVTKSVALAQWAKRLA